MNHIQLLTVYILQIEQWEKVDLLEKGFAAREKHVPILPKWNMGY